MNEKRRLIETQDYPVLRPVDISGLELYLRSDRKVFEGLNKDDQNSLDDQ